MKKKKEQKINGKGKILIYAIFIGIIILCIFNYITLMKVKNNLYDTFFVDDFYFIYSQDGTYTMSFTAISAQNQSYSSKDKLYFYFKCYDKNGALVDDGIQVEMDGNMLGAQMSYNSDDGNISLINSDSISYCELNYVNIVRNNIRIINAL